MSKRLLVAAAAAVVMLLTVIGCGLSENDAASVNGVPISKEAVDHRIELTRILFPSEVPADTESQEFLDYRGKVTKQLVSEEIERQEAEKRGLSVSDEEVEDALGIYVEDKYLGNVEKMEQSFADQGVSVDDLRDEIRRDLLHQKLLNSVRDETEVTDEEVAQFYEENRDRYVYPEKRQVRQVVCNDQATAQQAASRLTAGEDITVVAKELSVDAATANRAGLIGMVSRDQLPPKVGEVAFSMQEKQVSQPFQGDDSRWYVLQVDLVTPASNKTLEDLQEELKFYLRNQRCSERWREYSEELWQTYDIKYAEGYTPPPEGESDTGTATTEGSAPAVDQ